MEAKPEPKVNSPSVFTESSGRRKATWIANGLAVTIFIIGFAILVDVLLFFLRLYGVVESKSVPVTSYYWRYRVMLFLTVTNLLAIPIFAVLRARLRWLTLALDWLLIVAAAMFRESELFMFFQMNHWYLDELLM